MTETETAEYPTQIIDMRLDLVVRVALLGLGLGIVAWGLSSILNLFIIRPVMCGSTAVEACNSSAPLAGNIAMVLVGVAGILGLVRLGVYRPMLIVLAVCATVWGLGGWMANIAWYEALGWTGLIYMVAYAAFAWMVRPRNLIVVLISLILVIVAARFVTTL